MPLPSRIRSSLVKPAALGLLLFSAWPAAAAGNGKVTCEIMENGRPASGIVRLLQGDAEIASGACGKAVDVAPGQYTAALGLDGALDGPEQRKQVTVVAGQSLKVDADFATGLLEVRIKAAGRDAAGMAIIRKDGKQIGTLGSGVSAHLSAGTYEVVARYRAQERKFDNVQIEKDQRTSLDAAFE